MQPMGLTRFLPRPFGRQSRLWWSVPLLLMTAVGYWYSRPPPSPFESGELVVLTRHSMTTYYLDATESPVGFEYELVSEFARRQGWQLSVQVADDVDDLIGALVGGRANLGAAGLTVTKARAGRLRFGPAYVKEKELLICGRQVGTFRSASAIADVRIEVVASSSHAERLRELQRNRPSLDWVEMKGLSTEELLERVASGLSDCTVADAATFDVNWNFLPNLRVALELSADRDIAWAFPQLADPRLLKAAEAFFADARRSGLLDRLQERYFGHLRRFAEADVLGILEKRTPLLGKLKPHFLRAQEETGLDWRLLAALAYQESQWDPLARSPTGVRGIMMLTIDTADRMGVADRLDPESSILGGARYLALLRDALPARIAEPDRTWMALAAYNIGMGHLEDARRLAGKLGRDPDQWRELKDVLPYLARSQYARQLRLGYARGGEARILAENVRLYYDILSRFEAPYLDLMEAVAGGA